MARPLEEFPDPILAAPWGDLGAIRHAAKLDGVWHADVELGYPVDDLQEEYRQQTAAWLGEPEIELELTFKPPPRNALSGVNNVIAVASGKGGVGKSTTAVNLALGMASIGAKVGILDADIYGPSLGLMLGVPPNRRPEVRDGKFFVPVRAHGIETMSMSMLVDDRTPMVWRGPMASGALQQLLGQSLWSDVDYLIVDMPPGTGDIQLTLSQQVAVSGAVIVTTPQNIALADAIKGIEMFQKVNIPILGVIENMSYFECDGCGKRHEIFDAAGGARVANDYSTRLLGEFPLDPAIRANTDAGNPPVVSDPDGAIARGFRDAARRTAAALWEAASQQAAAPTIAVDNA